MTPFLLETAQKILASHSRLEEVTLVFPNRRAILFFRKHLGALLKKPAFAPTMLTIEEYIKSFSTLQVPDKLELVYRLYRAYSETVKSKESFDRFYYWGEMLLRDFEEIDKYLVNAVWRFRKLSQQKELDASFDYHSDEQNTFLLDFWGNFNQYQTASRTTCLVVWKHLYDVYTT